MDNVNKLIRIYIIPFLFFLYFLFLLWEHNQTGEIRKNISLQIHDVVLNTNKIDGVILGGSNSFFSLSAKKLSQDLQSNWINLSLLNEGYSDNNYKDFVAQTIPDLKRDSVSNVVLSSVTLHRKGRFKIREKSVLNLFGQKTFDYLPDRNLAGFIKDFIFFTENKESAKYPMPDNYGDFNFYRYKCNLSGGRIRYSLEDIDVAERWINTKVSSINNLFPNAKIFIILPSEFKGEFLDPSASRTFFNNLEKIIKDKSLSLGIDIDLVPGVKFNNTDYLCDSYHHANRIGRILKTDDLISRLK